MTLRALTVASLLRALAHAGTTPAARQLVLLASDAGGVLRPELSAADEGDGRPRGGGAHRGARATPPAETRTWASNLLEGMGKRTPGDAVQTKDNQALADVLHAYASIKDLDALPVVLSFVNSDRVQVRAAAREATLAYGQDAPLEAARGLRRADGRAGAGRHRRGRPREEALRRLRPLPPPGGLRAARPRASPSRRTASCKEAIADFDEVLARQPMLDRRAEAVPAYVA